MIKNIYKSPLANTIIKDERLNMFLVRLGTRLACHLPPLLCNTVREVLPVLIRQGKKKKDIVVYAEKQEQGFFALKPQCANPCLNVMFFVLNCNVSSTLFISSICPERNR